MEFNTLATKALETAFSELVPNHDGSASSEVEVCIAAIIGFAGPETRGTLGVTTSHEGLGRVARSFGADGDPRTSEDSLGELANLLLGDIKRTFSSHGLEITLATPLVVRGSAIEICGREGGAWFEQTSEHGEDRVTVWFDAHVAEGIEISDEPVETNVIAQGDALLF